MEQTVTSNDPRPPGDLGNSRIRANNPKEKANVVKPPPMEPQIRGRPRSPMDKNARRRLKEKN